MYPELVEVYSDGVIRVVGPMVDDRAALAGDPKRRHRRVDVATDFKSTGRRATGIWQAALRWGPAGIYSRVVGAVSRVTLPAVLRGPAVNGFARAVGADVSEAELSTTEYNSLGAFFARRLIPGARPLDARAGSLLSPCDGIVSAVGTATQGKLVQAKDQEFSLADLVADADLAQQLEGGSYATVYL